MSDFTYCPYCARNVPYGDSRCSCGRELPTIGGVRESIGYVSSALEAQADIARNMLGALVNAQALPLVTLLESWWNKLNVKDQERFVEALVQRCLQLIEKGAVDEQLKPFTTSVFWRTNTEGLCERITGESREALQKAVLRIVEETLGGPRAESRDLRDAITAGVTGQVIDIARELTAGHTEVIEAAVRDRMVDVQVMVEDIIKGISEDTAKEVRERMKRASGD